MLDHDRAKLLGRLGGMAARGEKKGRLTADTVRAIRAASGSTRAIAKQFGIHYTHVGDIRNRAVWKHI